MSQTNLSKKKQLKQVKADLENDVDQLPLANQASDIVPAEGNAESELMFIGEAPGYHESVQRRPFVGRSGKFFRKVLREEAKISDKKVFISNVVKARPPENRAPNAKEIAAYRPYLNREIEIVKPLIIVTLGRFSMAKFLVDVKISQVHGRLHRVKWQDENLFVLPMFHPAAALRQGRWQKAFIDDFQKLPKILTWVKEKEVDFDFQDEVESALY